MAGTPRRYAWNERPIPRVQTFVKKFLERSGGKRPNSVRPRDVRPALHLQDVRRDQRRHQQGLTTSTATARSSRSAGAGLKAYDGAIGAVTMNELGVNVGQIWALTVKKGVFTLAE